MSTQGYSENIIKISKLIKDADYILIGAGAGLSASGGLNYGDPELFTKWFPTLKQRGIPTIAEAISTYWSANDTNRTSFWAYWANHIQRIRYDTPATSVYLDLLELIKDKSHFVITTNVDGQFAKAGFNRELIYSPQGDYGFFQCEGPCSDAVYDNQQMIHDMISNMDNATFQIRKSDIPHCPRCGDYLVKNLRVDGSFVETPHLVMRQSYIDFVDESRAGNLILLELGVGFNTPAIIRWPFEEISIKHPNAILIRLNMDHPEVLGKAILNSVSINSDIALILQDMMKYNYQSRNADQLFPQK